MNRLVKSFGQASTTNTINGIVDDESRGHVLADVTEKSGIRFQVQLMHGVKHGFGELSLPSGHWVRGRWAFNTLTGVGAYYGDGGALYEGHFENGVQEGMRVEVMPSGEMFQGQFVKGKRVRGVSTWPNGRIALRMYNTKGIETASARSEGTWKCMREHMIVHLFSYLFVYLRV